MLRQRLRRDDLDSGLPFAWVIGDVVFLASGALLAHVVRFHASLLPPPTAAPALFARYLTLYAFICVFSLGIFLMFGVYRRSGRHALTAISRTVASLAISYSFIFTLLFALKASDVFSRLALFLAFGMQVVLLAGWRVACGHLFAALHRRLPPLSVIIVGNRDTIVHTREILSARGGYKIIVTVCLQDCSDHEQWLERMHALLNESAPPGSVLLLGGIEMPPLFFQHIALECEKRLVDVRILLPFLQGVWCDMDVERIDDLAILRTRTPKLDHPASRAFKRAFDICGSLAGLVVGGPIALVAALLVRWESRGPLFYQQERCGIGGHIFKLYKVRTMVADAESQTGPLFTQPNDPRCTRVGRVLRRLNIDEIPQFWNVLKGDMSLVGPRPERPHFVNQFKEEVYGYMTRHRIKPGMTGWAQVCGWRGNTSIPDRVKHDLYYAQNWSPLFDVKVVGLTLLSMLTAKNAY